MNLDEYIEKLKNDEITLDDIPKELLESNSEKYFELFKEGYINFEDIPEEVMKNNIDKIFELYEANVYIDFEEIPESVFAKDLEKTIEFCQKNDLEIPESVLIANPNRAMQLCEEDKDYYFFDEILPEKIKEENPEFCKKQFVEYGIESAVHYFDVNTLTHEEILKYCEKSEDLSILGIYGLEKIVKQDMVNNIEDYINFYDKYGFSPNDEESFEKVILKVTKKDPEKALRVINHKLLFYADSVLEYIPEELLTEELVKEAIEIYPGNFSDIPEKYKENIDIKMLAYKSRLENNGEFDLEMFSEDDLDDVEFCKKIYDIDTQVLEYLPEDVLLDEDFMEVVLSKSESLEEFVDKYKKANINFENLGNLKKLIKVADFNDVYHKYEGYIEDQYVDEKLNKKSELLKYAKEIGKLEMSLDEKLANGVITEEEWVEGKLKEKEEELSKTAVELVESEKQLEAAKALRDDVAKEKGLAEQKRGE